MKKAIIPGSFDPVTVAHVDLIDRALPLFDEVLVALVPNTGKNYLFSEEARLEMLNTVAASRPKMKVTVHNGFLADLYKEYGACCAVKGIRNSSDFDYESLMAEVNRHFLPEFETLFLSKNEKFSHISSTVVRDVIKYNKDLKGLVPDELISVIKKYV